MLFLEKPEPRFYYGDAPETILKVTNISS